MSERIDSIVKAIPGLSPEDYTKTGEPKVEPLEVLAELKEITAVERDEAWKIYQASQAYDPDSDGSNIDPPATDDEAAKAKADAAAKAKADADAKAKADADAKAKADADAKAKAAKKAAGPAKYVIAVGKALTSKKGMLCAGDEVRPEYLRGDGEEALNAHVKAGTVVKE